MKSRVPNERENLRKENSLTEKWGVQFGRVEVGVLLGHLNGGDLCVAGLEFWRAPLQTCESKYGW